MSDPTTDPSLSPSAMPSPEDLRTLFAMLPPHNPERARALVAMVEPLLLAAAHDFGAVCSPLVAATLAGVAPMLGEQADGVLACMDGEKIDDALRFAAELLLWTRSTDAPVVASLVTYDPAESDVWAPEDPGDNAT